MDHVTVDDDDLDSIPWQQWTEEQWNQWEQLEQDARRWPLQFDSTVPPAATLVEWAEENGGDERGLRQQLARRDFDLTGLLDDPPAALTAEHAAQLEDLTAIPARIWKRFEAFYRAGEARRAKLAEMRATLGPSVSAGEILKQWADEHDPQLEQLADLFAGDDDEDKVYALLTNRKALTPEDALLLSALTQIASVFWWEQDAAWRTWMAEQKEKT